LNFQLAAAQMWGVAEREPGGGVVEAVDLSGFEVEEEELPCLNDLTVRQRRRVGSTIVTRWGRAKILKIVGFDEYLCRLPDDPKPFNLRLVDYSGDEAAVCFGPFSMVSV
jgi:hypothetical protein